MYSNANTPVPPEQSDTTTSHSTIYAMPGTQQNNGTLFKPHFKVFFTPGKGTIASFLHVYEVATFGADPEYKAKHVLGFMSRAAQETLTASLQPGLIWDQTMEILTQEFGSS